MAKNKKTKALVLTVLALMMAGLFFSGRSQLGYAFKKFKYGFEYRSTGSKNPEAEGEEKESSLSPARNLAATTGRKSNPYFPDKALVNYNTRSTESEAQAVFGDSPAAQLLVAKSVMGLYIDASPEVLKLHQKMDQDLQNRAEEVVYLIDNKIQKLEYHPFIESVALNTLLKISGFEYEKKKILSQVFSRGLDEDRIQLNNFLPTLMMAREMGLQGADLAESFSKGFHSSSSKNNQDQQYRNKVQSIFPSVELK